MTLEFENPSGSMEVAIDSSIYDMFGAVDCLDAKRRDHNARPYLKECAEDIEMVRDKLSVILDDVRGLS